MSWTICNFWKTNNTKQKQEENYIVISYFTLEPKNFHAFIMDEVT